MFLLDQKNWFIRSDDEVVVICPNCGFKASLDHEIASDGKITPSLLCPNEKCNFHHHVTLVGWNEEDIK